MSPPQDRYASCAESCTCDCAHGALVYEELLAGDGPYPPLAWRPPPAWAVALAAVARHDDNRVVT